MPFNEPGYQILGVNGAALPNIANLIQVPCTEMDIVTLRASQEVLGTYMSDDSYEWWSDTLDTFQNEQDNLCEVCLSFRKVLRTNASCTADAKEAAKTKRSLHSKAYLELFSHLSANENGAHPKWVESPFPSQQWVWKDNKYTRFHKDRVAENIDSDSDENSVADNAALKKIRARLSSQQVQPFLSFACYCYLLHALNNSLSLCSPIIYTVI